MKIVAPVPITEYAYSPHSNLVNVKGSITKSVVAPIDKSVTRRSWFHDPPEIVLPLEQSTILTVDAKERVAGLFPIAVTIKVNAEVVS